MVYFETDVVINLAFNHFSERRSISTTKYYNEMVLVVLMKPV